MALPKSKTTGRVVPRRKARVTAKSKFAASTAAKPLIAPGKNAEEIKAWASRSVLKPMLPLLEGYSKALAESIGAGHSVSFRVEINPEGQARVGPVKPAVGKANNPEKPSSELKKALEAARGRGRLRAAEILSDDEMLSADAFAAVLGTTRVTVNTKRQNGQILGLDGTKRGFRFPLWQLDRDGKPYAELQHLHEQLGGAWAVYRFLVQPHGELDGLTGLQALERGKSKAVLDAVESVLRDFT